MGYNSLSLSYYHYYRDIGDAGDNAADGVTVEETGVDEVEKPRKKKAAAKAPVKGLFLEKPITGFGVWHSDEAQQPIEVARTSSDRVLFPKSKLTKASSPTRTRVETPIVAA